MCSSASGDLKKHPESSILEQIELTYPLVAPFGSNNLFLGPFYGREIDRDRQYPGGTRKRDPALNMNKWVMDGREAQKTKGPPAPGPGPLNYFIR